MKGTTKLWRRTAQSATWGSPLPLVKTQSGEPGGAVDRGGLVPQRRDVFEVAPSHNRVYDEHKRPDNPRGCQLRVGSWNVGTMSRRDGEVADMATRRCLDFCCLQEQGREVRVTNGLVRRARDTSSSGRVRMGWL